MRQFSGSIIRLAIAPAAVSAVISLSVTVTSAEGRGPDPATSDNISGGFLLEADPLNR